MKYTEKVGSIEQIYEGTPQEIIDLYNKMNPLKVFKIGSTICGDDAKELIPNMKSFNLMPSGQLSHNPCQPMHIKPNPTYNPNIQIHCEASVDKIVAEVAKNLSKNLNKSMMEI